MDLSMSGLLATILGLAGCALLIVTLVAVAWAITYNRRPPSP